jgi:hypothetical protein
MDKWVAILLVVFIVGMFSPVVVSENAKSTCKIEAIKAGMSADDILKLCK